MSLFTYSLEELYVRSIQEEAIGEER